VDYPLDFKNSFGFPFNSKTLGLFTAAYRAVSQACINLIKRMAALAQCASRVVGPSVFLCSYCAQVPGVNAALDVTRVIHNEVLRDVAVECPVRNSVSPSWRTPKAKSAVAVLIEASGPQPAPASSFLYKGPKACAFLFGHSFRFWYVNHAQVST